MVNKALSEPQMAVLRAIKNFVAANRIPPTYEEIASAVDRKKDTVRASIRRLIAKGLLSRVPNARYRSLVVTDAGMAAARKQLKKKGAK